MANNILWGKNIERRNIERGRGEKLCGEERKESGKMKIK